MLSTAYLQIKSFKAKLQVGHETSPVNKQEDLDISKLTIDAIANLPPSERKGAGIAKEVWKQFAEDYIAIMPSLQGKSVENVTNAAKIFVARMQPCKTNKPVLSRLKDYLNLYFNKDLDSGRYARSLHLPE